MPNREFILSDITRCDITRSIRNIQLRLIMRRKADYAATRRDPISNRCIFTAYRSSGRRSKREERTFHSADFSPTRERTFNGKFNVKHSEPVGQVGAARSRSPRTTGVTWSLLVPQHSLARSLARLHGYSRLVFTAYLPGSAVVDQRDR